MRWNLRCHYVAQNQFVSILTAPFDAVERGVIAILGGASVVSILTAPFDAVELASRGRSTDKLPVSILTAPFDAVEHGEEIMMVWGIAFQSSPHLSMRWNVPLPIRSLGEYVSILTAPFDAVERVGQQGPRHQKTGFNPHRTFRCGGTWLARSR